jgi:flagellar basal-body rod modification protein FlgD
MNIQAVAAAAQTAASSVTSQAQSGLDGNSFLTLLTAQLKSQDPTAPQDPTAFVTQLVQFNSLQQLIQINQDLTPPATTVPAAAVPPTASNG